jgi:hypothetical protein
MTKENDTLSAPPGPRRNKILVQVLFWLFAVLVYWQAAVEPWNTVRPILFGFNLATIGVIAGWVSMVRMKIGYAKHAGWSVLLSAYLLAWFLLETNPPK